MESWDELEESFKLLRLFGWIGLLGLDMVSVRFVLQWILLCFYGGEPKEMPQKLCENISH